MNSRLLRATYSGIGFLRFRTSLIALGLGIACVMSSPADAATISGTVYTDEGSTNAGAGRTVRLIVNGVDTGTNVTDASGNYSIVATLAAGDAMLVYLDGETIDATTVTVVPSICSPSR